MSQSRIGVETPCRLLSRGLYCSSFGSHCAGRVTISVSISIILPYTPVVRFQSLCCSELKAQTVEDLFPSPTSTVGYNFSFHWKRYSPTRNDVAKRRRVDNEGSTCKVLFVSCQQVRCHEMLDMSIKMYVISGHDGVQMILPVGSQWTRLQVWVCLNIERTTIELEVSTPLCDEHVCGDSSSSYIRNNPTFKVSS